MNSHMKLCGRCSRRHDEVSFRAALTCIYGGAALQPGGTWVDSTSADVVRRLRNQVFDERGRQA